MAHGGASQTDAAFARELAKVRAGGVDAAQRIAAAGRDESQRMIATAAAYRAAESAAEELANQVSRS